MGCKRVVVYVYRTYNCRSFFRKIKQFLSSKVSFKKKFSSSDHLNVINTIINIYFDCILAKTRRNKVTIKQYYGYARACWYRKNIIKTYVFVVGKTVKLFLKAVL